jgi:type VI secretion system secreted protein VgrG
VNTQAQSDAFTLTAQKAVDLQSTTANITISAPNRILLNGGGGYIKIEGGDIEIGTSGQAGFKASMKELTSGSSASGSAPELKKASALKGCAKSMQEAAAIGAAV